ncbi:hypothetical protein QO009_002052 [Brevibacillus aydinogluensis]|uniref:hypothetical protein n=1 Tax=Brevibacillus aydinogluensis TaxID=927786 RepID=UPI002892C3B3|nr:hypothetical protein [Brevibacillus aydinogluensis]MDT3416184.1 hypothetical protein [Brevibacillus aydinogluensis]
MMDVLRAHGIGKGLNAADKQALIDIVNRADSNESVIRTSIVNALNAVSTDKALGLNAASAWADILVAIPQVKTGKKWASGTASTTATVLTITVRGLTFQPKAIFAKSTADDTTGSGNGNYMVVYIDKTVLGLNNDISARIGTGPVGGQWTKYADGFEITMDNYSKSYKWIAFE